MISEFLAAVLNEKKKTEQFQFLESMFKTCAHLSKDLKTIIISSTFMINDDARASNNNNNMHSVQCRVQ